MRDNWLRWDGWDALAAKKWVRMEDNGHVDADGRPGLKSVYLMEEFFENIHRQMYLRRNVISRCEGHGEVVYLVFLLLFLFGPRFRL